jgi:hypothetical protein
MEDQIHELVRGVLNNACDEGSCPEMSQAKTFEEAEIATPDSGLVLTMNDGSQFSVAIVRSA